MARLPHFRISKFLKDIVEEWEPLETDSDDFRTLIRQAIIEREIAITTTSVYLTAVKRACLESGKSLNPKLYLELKHEVARNQENKHQVMEEWKQFIASNNYNQYKLYTSAKLNIQPTPFQRILKELDFFIDPEVWNEWSVKSVMGDEYQVNLEQKRETSFIKQLSDIIVIEKPMLLQNTLLSGLFSEKKSLLLPALLFACGRRSSAVVLNQDDFKPAAEFGENAINSYAFDFVERLKQGLRVIPTQAPSLPLLAPYGLFKQALDRFHTKLVRPYVDVSDVNRNLSAHFSMWTLKRTGGLLKQARQLRVLYAKYVAVLFGQKEHQNLFIQRALVHASVTASLNYTRISFPYGDNAVHLWIPAWVAQGHPHPLPNLPLKQQQEEKKSRVREESARPYDAKRDIESQTDDIHHLLLPGENEDEFQERNLQAEKEEKRIPLEDETEIQRQERQVGGLRDALPRDVVQPFGLPEKKKPKRTHWYSDLPSPKEFKISFS